MRSTVRSRSSASHYVQMSPRKPPKCLPITLPQTQLSCHWPRTEILCTIKSTFPRWILVGRCCTLPMTNVQPLDRSIKDFPAPASTPSRLGTSNLLPTRSAAQTFLSGIPDKSHCAAGSTASPRCRCKWTGSKPCDTPQNLPEQVAWHRHFGHLEGHVLGVLCYLGTHLHQFLPQRRQ